MRRELTKPLASVSGLHTKAWPLAFANVRLWHKADMLNALTNVRFWRQADIDQPLLTNLDL